MEKIKELKLKNFKKYLKNRHKDTRVGLTSFKYRNNIISKYLKSIGLTSYNVEFTRNGKLIIVDQDTLIKYKPQKWIEPFMVSFFDSDPTWNKTKQIRANLALKHLELVA